MAHGCRELLSVVITSVLKSGESITVDGQTFWKHSDVDSAGKTFLTWMNEIRHRGTFSKLATAFASLVQQVNPVKELSDLPMSWLEVSCDRVHV